MKVFVVLLCYLATLGSGSPIPDGDHIHAHLLTPVAQPALLPLTSAPVLAPRAPLLTPVRVFPQAAFAPGPVLTPLRSGPFISAAPAPVFASPLPSKPFVFFGNRFVTTEATRQAVPETTVAPPALEITEAPVPETTEEPAPETTAAPAPETIAAPAPETTVAPETTAAPAPETRAAPAELPAAPLSQVYTIAAPNPVVVASTRLEEPVLPATYAYNYGVRDDLNSVNFGQAESRDGYLASGQYFVNLPDGRLQTVTYHADANGYVAEVSYS